MRNEMMMAAALGLALVVGTSGLGWAEAAHGLWRTEANDEGAHLEIAVGPCANDASATCGVIQTARDASGQSGDYAHLGREMITGMTADGTNYSGGRIWAPDEDKTYRATMGLDGDVLTVEGCVLIICRGQDWTRVQ